MSASNTISDASRYGTFEPVEPQLAWLTHPQDPDRLMQLLGSFAFHDRKIDKVWTVEAGYQVDGASIPQALWTLVGSPYTGDYRRASIVHDKACDGANAQQRREADKMFFRACRAGGCSVRDATLLYIGVRIGAWIGGNVLWRRRMAEDADAVTTRRSSLQRRIEADFGLVSDQVLEAEVPDDADVIERRTDEAMEMWMGLVR